MFDLCRWFPAPLLDLAWLNRDDLTVFDKGDCKLQVTRPVGTGLEILPTTELLYLWAVGQALDGGAKIIRPSLSLCHALEHVDLRLDFDEYAQPYPGLFMILPAGFLGTRESPCVSGWRKGHGICVSFLDDSAFRFWSTISRSSCGGRTLETALSDRDPAGPITLEEESWLHRCVRVVMNLNLFAVERGYRVEPPTAKQSRRLDSRKERLQARQARQLEIQNLDVIMRACSPERPVCGEGSPKSLHRRRGHWRSQAYGPGWTDHRRIFVDSCWVGLQRGGEKPFRETVLT